MQYIENTRKTPPWNSRHRKSEWTPIASGPMTAGGWVAHLTTLILLWKPHSLDHSTVSLNLPPRRWSLNLKLQTIHQRDRGCKASENCKSKWHARRESTACPPLSSAPNKVSLFRCAAQVPTLRSCLPCFLFVCLFWDRVSHWLYACQFA